jgi:hypothetical protein
VGHASRQHRSGCTRYPDVVTESSSAAAPPPAYGPIPVVPEGAVQLAPRSIPQAIWRGVIGLGLVGAGIGAQVAGSGFPSNAPVEMLTNFILTATAVAAGLVLIVFAIVAAVARSLPLTRGAVSPLAITAITLSLVAVIVCLIALPGQVMESGATGIRLRYSNLSGPAFGTGFLWATGIVMGAISFRSPALLSKILAVGAVVLGFAVFATNIWAAAIYSAGLTD